MLRYSYLLMLSLSLLSAMLFQSCKSTQSITAPAPKEQHFSPLPEVKTSFVYLPLSLPVKRVNEIANTEIPKILYEEQEQSLGGGAKVRYKIERLQNLTVQPVSAGVLDFFIPIKISGRVEWASPERIGFQLGSLDLSTDVKKINLGKDFSYNYDLKFKTKLELTSDWNLNTQLLGRFDWGKLPQVKVGDYSLNFDTYAGTGLQSKLNGYVEGLENKLKSMVNLKERVKPMWNELNKPVQLYNDPPVWLQLSPEKINFVTRENKNKDTLLWNLGVVTRLQTFVGAPPKASPNTSLPQISNAETKDNRFFLHLPVRVSYKDLTELAHKQLSAQEWDAGKYKVKFLQTEIKTDGEKLLIFLDLQAQKSGKKKITKAKIWLHAKPVYDPIHQTLSAEELDFDVETRKALINVADWLLHGFILKKAQEAARYNLKNDMENARKQLTETLSGLEAGPYLILKGRINSLKFDNLYLSADGLEVRLLTEGNLEGKLK